MATVLITPLAQEDLGNIWDYAAESGVERADRLLDLINEKCQRLAEYPEMGRARHELLVDLRSFTVKNYVDLLPADHGRHRSAARAARRAGHSPRLR